MRTKHLLIVLLIVAVFGCKKSPDLSPDTIRLTKVEYIYGNDLLLNTINTDTFSPSFYDKYVYDPQGRPIEKQTWYGDSLSFLYKAEYNSDGHISKIALNYLQEYFKTNNVTFSYTWARDSIIARADYTNGTTLNYLFELDANQLPIRKVLRRTSYTPEYDFRTNYDANGNAKVILFGTYLDQEYVEYDLSKFNPYSCSYELRLFSILTYPFSGLFPLDAPISRNWLLKRQPSQYPTIDGAEKIIESNSIGYPTKTRRSDSIRRYRYN